MTSEEPKGDGQGCAARTDFTEAEVEGEKGGWHLRPTEVHTAYQQSPSHGHH